MLKIAILALALASPMPLEKPKLPDTDPVTPAMPADRYMITLGYPEYPECTLQVPPWIIWQLAELGVFRWAEKCKLVMMSG